MTSDNDRRSQKIFLTGACGKLSRAFRKLTGKRYAISGIDVETRGDRDVVRGSYHDRDLVLPLMEGCEMMVHNAAMHSAQRHTHSEADFIHENVEGLARLLAQCVEVGIKRVVYASTLEIIMSKKDMLGPIGWLDENTPPNPAWIYPMTKLQGELLGKYYYERHGLEFVALRFCRIFDTEDVIRRNPKELLLQTIVRGNDHMDAARAIECSLSVPFIGYETFVIAPQPPFEPSEVIRASGDAEAIMRNHWPARYPALKEHGIHFNWHDFWPMVRTDKARKILGWQPQVTFEDYFEEFLQAVSPVYANH